MLIHCDLIDHFCLHLILALALTLLLIYPMQLPRLHLSTYYTEELNNADA